MSLVEALSEAHSHHGAYKKVVELFRFDPEALRTVRQRVALGVSLAELGEDVDAARLLYAVASGERAKTIPPITHYYLAKLSLKRSGSKADAIAYLERFLSASAVEADYLVDGWDPYSVTAKREVAQTLLADLKALRR